VLLGKLQAAMESQVLLFVTLPLKLWGNEAKIVHKFCFLVLLKTIIKFAWLFHFLYMLVD
jgi:hypothetical protein